MRIKKIKLSQVDFNDRSFAISFPPEPSRQLLRSIRTFGMICPPVLVRRERDKFQIVTGFRRLQACRKVKHNEVTCRVLSSKTKREILFQLAISDNLCQRTKFNEIELSQIINRLEKFLSVERIVKRYFPLVGLHPSPEIYYRLRPLVRLEKKIKLAIADGELTAGEGLEMLNFRAEERRVIFNLSKQLHLTYSLRRELWENLTAIARRDGLSINQVINSSEIQAVLSNPELATSLKVERIRYIIRKWRYPLITKVEEKFHSVLRRLHLPAGVQLIPPPFFETDNYKLQLNFHTPRELRSQLTNLHLKADSLVQAVEEIVDLV